MPGADEIFHKADAFHAGSLYQEFSEPMSDFDQMNQEYMNATGLCGGILSTGGTGPGDVKALSGSMGGD